MRAWVDALLAVVLAPQCAVCSQPLEHPTRGCVCGACWHSIPAIPPPRCIVCGDHVSSESASICGPCVRNPPVVDRARAVGLHAGALRGIVHALKYDGHRSLAPLLAALMRVSGAELIACCEVAVPVPLHPSRRRTRGFNQADDLARHLGLPVVRALERVRSTETQTALPASERHANVAAAFRPTRSAVALRARSVLLVDDVRTTGATLDACAAALKQAGVRTVCALTAGRVERSAW